MRSGEKKEQFNPDLNSTHQIIKMLEKSKKTSENMLYYVPNPMLVIDEQCRILTANAAAEKIQQVKRGALLFTKMERFFSPKTWNDFQKKILTLTEIQDSKKPIEFELPVDGTDKKLRYYKWNIQKISKLSERRGKLFIVIANDITEMRLMIEQVEAHSCKLQEMLEIIQGQQVQIVESSKLAQLGIMAAGIAHEINNPLTIVSGASEKISRIIKSHPIDCDNLEQTAKQIKRGVERIESIVKSTLSLTRDADQDPFLPTELVEMGKDALNFFGDSFKQKKIEIRSVFPPNSVVCECRAVQISQVLINLLGNARDAIADLLEENKWVELEVISTADQVKLMVTDSGPGIPEEIANKIMQAFFTTKPAGKGTGLGLSISRTIMKEHGGELILDRKCPNTRFIIVLPLHQ